MPWYYAGPEAKPVGPISVEELHARRAGGVISPETYVIEQTGQPLETLTWKRYQELFPASPAPPSLPPLPTVPAPPPAFVPPASVPPAAQPHPLFPSAAPIPTQHPIFPHAPVPDPYYKNAKPSNSYCMWGFVLGLVGLFSFWACGIGLILAVIALPVCIIGLIQVHKHHEQGGKGMAIAGLILSGLAILLSLIFLISIAVPMLKAHGLTITEQTSNDSE